MPKEKVSLQASTPLVATDADANTSAAFYSLLQDKENKKTQLLKIERQFNLSEQLLSKANDQQSLQLVNKKEECLQQKEILQKGIQGIEQTQVLINQCRLSFEFIEDFYVFSMDLLNSSKEEKLIKQTLYKLKEIEKSLMELAPIENYLFYGESAGLNYSDYQSCIENYRTSFFLALPSGEAQYSDYVLFARKIRIWFISNYSCIGQGYFDLKKVRYFLQPYISKLAFPNSEYCLIGLWVSFLYIVLFGFIKLQPITSNFVKIKLAMEFHSQSLNFAFKENYFYKFIASLKKFTNLEKQVVETFFQDKKLITREEAQVVFSFIKETRNKTLFIEKEINSLLNARKFLKMLGALEKILHEKKALDVLKILKNTIGLDFSLIEMQSLDIRDVKTHKDALRYFFCMLYMEKIRHYLSESLATLTNRICPSDGVDEIITIESFEAKDFIMLSYCCFII